MVLVVGLLVRVEQERQILLDVTLRDRKFFAHALHAAVEGRVDPLAEATRILDREEVAEAHIEARLVSVIGARGLPLPALPPDASTELIRGEPVVTVHGPEILTYVPLGTPDRLALELAEPRAVDALLGRIRVVTLAWQSALLSGLVAVVTFALIRWLVGGPLSRLTTLARKIAAGDLGARAALAGSDEVSVLGGEMNLMAERLEGARRAVEEADARRVEALEELRHADRLRTVGQLASALAHELGTPLNVVSGHARIIEGEDDTTAEARASARTILEQAERMTRIIRNVLDYSRRSGPQTVERDLGELARHAAETLAPLTKRERVVIEVTGEDDPIRAKVDPQQILQVLTNLLVNAMQSMPEGGRVEVRLGRAERAPPTGIPEPAGPYARLSIIDEGAGIDPADLPHLFEPFYTRKAEGTGLGLAVVEGIVRDHHGWVEVSSELGRGSRFDVYIPTPKGERRVERGDHEAR